MEKFIFDLSVIIILAAILSYVAVLLKQPIILAYIACGVLAGPWGMGWIRDLGFIESISRLGITLLLFLAGLCLHPQKLFGLFDVLTSLLFHSQKNSHLNFHLKLFFQLLSPIFLEKL